MTGFVFDLFHHAAPSAPDPRLDQVLATLATIIANQRTIMASLNDIRQAVIEEQEVEASVIALLGHLHDELQTAVSNNDPVGLQAILDDLTANRNALAAAVVANTDSAPAPAPDPVPEPVPPAPAPDAPPPSPAAA